MVKPEAKIKSAVVGRLTNVDVLNLFKIPTTIKTQFFACRFKQTNLPLRLSVIAPKKIWRTATARNKVKRRVREAIYKSNKAPKTGDLLVSCFGPSKDVKFQELIKATESLLVYNRQT